MLAVTAALLVALGGAPVDQDRPPRAPQTDQTVPVSRGARLKVNNFAGEVILHTWDKDAVRIQAHHSNRAKVNIRSDKASVTVEASSMSGPIGSVDDDITAPAWDGDAIEGS